LRGDINSVSQQSLYQNSKLLAEVFIVALRQQKGHCTVALKFLQLTEVEVAFAQCVFV
jgi:hypothetical protein